jgi:uncharacterized protein DUF1360
MRRRSSGRASSRGYESGAGLFGVRVALGSLATWRLTHLLAEEDGPGGVVLRLRLRAGDGPFGELMDCFYCLSAWVAAPVAVAVAPRRRDAPLVWLALSGAACVLERATAEAVTFPAAAPGTSARNGAADVEARPPPGRAAATG